MKFFFLLFISFAKNAHSAKYWKNFMTTEYSALTKPLPTDVHLLTMETIRQNTVLMRFENYVEAYEGGEEIEIDLGGLFKEFSVVSLTEMNLSASQKLKEKQMWDWNTNETQFHLHHEENYIRFKSAMKVSLKPMEIRTFIVEIKKN